jgi:UrcA family protein
VDDSSGASLKLRGVRRLEHPSQVTGANIMSFKSFYRGARPGSWRAAFIGAATLGTLLGAATPALADPEPKQVKVDFQDLDLARQQDVQRLYSRLKSAARSACSPLQGREQFRRLQYRECFDTSLANAVNEVNITQLSKLHGADQKLAQRASAHGSGG